MEGSHFADQRNVLIVILHHVPGEQGGRDAQCWVGLQKFGSKVVDFLVLKVDVVRKP